MRIRKPSAIVVLASLFLVLSLVAGGGVVLAQPTITGVNPDVGLRDSLANVTITGTGFIAQQNVTDVCFSGDGITVNYYTVLSDTQIVANLTIDAAAVTGLRDVTVWDYYGNYTTLPEGFDCTYVGEIRNLRVDSDYCGITSTLTNTTSVEIGCGRVLETREYSLSACYSNWFRYNQYSNTTGWVLHEQYLGTATQALGNTTVQRVLTGQPTSFECNRKNVESHSVPTYSDWTIVDSWVIRDGAGICQRWVLKSRSITTDSWQTYEHCTSTGWVVVEGPHTILTTLLPPIEEEYGDPYACPSPGGGI